MSRPISLTKAFSYCVTAQIFCVLQNSHLVNFDQYGSALLLILVIEDSTGGKALHQKLNAPRACHAGVGAPTIYLA
jgi:hypothetical protein